MKNLKIDKSFVKQLVCDNKALVIMAVYAVIYLITFAYLENRDVTHYTIESVLDHYIPFCEVFVIPYFLWFPYVALTVCFICLFDKEEGNPLVAFLIIGMTIFLVVSAVFPNGHNLRPAAFERDNIFTDMIAGLYKTDTSTNILPSIHVYNSIAIMIAVYRSRCFKKHIVIKSLMILLGASIICSTVLIKQHSMIDVFLAFIIAIVMFPLCYRKAVFKEKSAELAGASIEK